MTVRMEFTGIGAGTQMFTRLGAHIFKRPYKGGNNPTNRYEDVDPDDVEALKSTGKWKVAARPVEAQEGQNLPAPQKIVYDPPKPVDLEQIKREAAAAIKLEFAEEPKGVDKADETDAITPAARREAESSGVDIGKITGTGRDGKITVFDVRQAAKQLA